MKKRGFSLLIELRSSSSTKDFRWLLFAFTCNVSTACFSYILHKDKFLLVHSNVVVVPVTLCTCLYVCLYVCMCVCPCCKRKPVWAIKPKSVVMYSVRCLASTDPEIKKIRGLSSANYVCGQWQSRHGSACRYDCLGFLVRLYGQNRQEWQLVGLLMHWKRLVARFCISCQGKINIVLSL